ncbi:hypothetical protein MAP00_006366 [Monascus purpureus]|nr:hypothetical protein MAP00_006366 [Monascus purpureus]
MSPTAALRKLFLISLVSTAYAAATRYNVPLPEGATVLDTENDLREFVTSHPDVDLETANGGYTIQQPNGLVLAYVGDSLSKDLDERMKSLELYENLLAEKGMQV